MLESDSVLFDEEVRYATPPFKVVDDYEMVNEVRVVSLAV
jgi:hypothetical protein